MLQSRLAGRGRGSEAVQSAPLRKPLWSSAISPHRCHPGLARLIDWLKSQSHTARRSIKNYRLQVQVWGRGLIELDKLVTAEVITPNCCDFMKTFIIRLTVKLRDLDIGILGENICTTGSSCLWDESFCTISCQARSAPSTIAYPWTLSWWTFRWNWGVLDLIACIFWGYDFKTMGQTAQWLNIAGCSVAVIWRR